MAVLDVIKFDGLRSHDWLIFKYYTENIVLGSQLIVQEGQCAIFVKGGAVADVFYPGTYTLSTDNLPIISKLVNLPFGGKTPFSAEIYYINTTVQLDINWGTTDPIQVIDPKYYVKLRVRAFGQMGLKVLDSVQILRQIIGAMQKSDVIKFDKVKDYFRGLLVIKAKSAIANAIITNGYSVLELSSQLELLSDKVKVEVEDKFAEYGFEVANFYIQSINFPDEDFEKINKILEDKAAFEIMGDSRYTTKRSLDVYEGAATNQNGVAGAFMSGGIGFGAGMGMAEHMSNSMMSPNINGNMKVCYACHAQMLSDARFCSKCGADNSKRICECGNELGADSRFCPKCGKKVE